MPSSAASHHQNSAQSLFVEKLLQPVFFFSGDALVLVTVGAGKLKRAALRFHAGINPLPWLSVFSARLCCCLCVCLCPSVQRPREPFLFSGFISLKRRL